MGDEKNGGPNYLRAWREFRGLSQGKLAELVNTNQNMIAYLESGERALSAKWLRKLAPALETQPGMILDHDPNQLDTDIIDIWAHIPDTNRAIAKSVLERFAKTGTDD